MSELKTKKEINTKINELSRKAIHARGSKAYALREAAKVLEWVLNKKE